MVEERKDWAKEILSSFARTPEEREYVAKFLERISEELEKGVLYIREAFEDYEVSIEDALNPLTQYLSAGGCVRVVEFFATLEELYGCMYSLGVATDFLYLDEFPEYTTMVDLGTVLYILLAKHPEVDDETFEVLRALHRYHSFCLTPEEAEAMVGAVPGSHLSVLNTLLALIEGVEDEELQLELLRWYCFHYLPHLVKASTEVEATAEAESDSESSRGWQEELKRYLLTRFHEFDEELMEAGIEVAIRLLDVLRRNNLDIEDYRLVKRVLPVNTIAKYANDIAEAMEVEYDMLQVEDALYYVLPRAYRPDEDGGTPIYNGGYFVLRVPGYVRVDIDEKGESLLQQILHLGAWAVIETQKGYAALWRIDHFMENREVIESLPGVDERYVPQSFVRVSSKPMRPDNELKLVIGPRWMAEVIERLQDPGFKRRVLSHVTVVLYRGVEASDFEEAIQMAKESKSIWWSLEIGEAEQYGQLIMRAIVPVVALHDELPVPYWMGNYDTPPEGLWGRAVTRLSFSTEFFFGIKGVRIEEL